MTLVVSILAGFAASVFIVSGRDIGEVTEYNDDGEAVISPNRWLGETDGFAGPLGLFAGMRWLVFTNNAFTRLLPDSALHNLRDLFGCRYCIGGFVAALFYFAPEWVQMPIAAVGGVALLYKLFEHLLGVGADEV